MRTHGGLGPQERVHPPLIFKSTTHRLQEERITRPLHTRVVLNGKKKLLWNMVFSKTTACSSYVQPWLVAIGGWRLVEIAGWRLAVGGWWRLAAVGNW